jgi:hypothetical protein
MKQMMKPVYAEQAGKKIIRKSVSMAWHIPGRN